MAVVLLYLLAVAILDWIAYSLYSEKWARKERARTVLGVLLVFGVAIGPAWLGVLDIKTVGVLFAGFGVAGAVTLYRDIEEDTTGADQLFRDIVNDSTD